MKPTKVQKAALRKFARAHGTGWFCAQEVIWALGKAQATRMARALVNWSFLDTKYEYAQLFRLTVYGWQAISGIVEKRRDS